MSLPHGANPGCTVWTFRTSDHDRDWIEATSHKEARERALAIGISEEALKNSLSGLGSILESMAHASWVEDECPNTIGGKTRLHLDDGRIFYYDPNS